MLSSRRHGRQLALQQLFRWEFDQSQNHDIDVIKTGRSASPPVREFATQIVQGVLSHHLELDRLINAFALEWTVDRMPVVDRNILRWAIFELIWLEEIPAKVTINEALELAKRFADDQARRFINGVLNRLLQEEPRLESKREELAL